MLLNTGWIQREFDSFARWIHLELRLNTHEWAKPPSMAPYRGLRGGAVTRGPRHRTCRIMRIEFFFVGWFLYKINLISSKK